MINIIFSTYNGSSTIDRMLNAIAQSDLSMDQWRVIAVDNGSTDLTANILSKHKKFIPMTILSYTERGKNKALNFALQYVDAEFVVFTDDDVVPEKDWLRKHLEYAEKNEMAAIIGGAIEPDWPAPPPQWLLDGVPMEAVYAVTEPTQKTGAIDPSKVWGPNMLVRSEVFNAGFQFNEQVGPAEGQYIMGSETEFNKRVVSAGYQCHFNAQARVKHQIRLHQMEPGWLAKRAFRRGRHLASISQPSNKKNWLFGAPRWLWKDLAISFVGQARCKLFGTPTSAMRSTWRLGISKGQAYQYRLSNVKDRRSN